MMKRITSLIILIVVSLAASTAFSQAVDTAVDTNAATSADSLLNITLEKFKNLKFIKLEGAPTDSVSIAAMDICNDATAAIGQQSPGSPEWLQLKEVLRDTQRDILSGAFYYSKAGNSQEMTRYARTFLDISLMDTFREDPINLDPSTLAMIAYISASGAYNVGEYGRAIDYFKIYLGTGDDKQREQVYLFMMQSCLQDHNYDLGLATADEALVVYPGHENVLLLAMQMCIDGGRAENLQKYLSMALERKPDDTRLLDIQGKLYEDAGEYDKALEVYTTLDQLRPNSLANNKHIALCYYNQAVSFFNQAINESDEKAAARQRRRAKTYFASAVEKFTEVLEAAPTAVPYLRSLGVCYLCLEDKYNFEKINERLRLLREDPLAEVFMPPTMTYTGDGRDNYVSSKGSALRDAPSFSSFAQDYILTRLDSWAKKGEFEKMDDFSQRVNQNTIRTRYAELKKEAADKYMDEYSGRLRLNDLVLEPYDATNEVFRISSSYGPILLRVPIKNGEAETFKQNFKSIRFQNPRFFIDDDSVRIAEITFLTANGKKYDFNNAKAVNYSVPDIAIDFASILAEQNKNVNKNRSGKNNEVYIAATSDVDVDIPQGRKPQSNKLALVIANENYKNVSKVPSAFADGFTFSEYCKKTLSIPEENVTLCVDASLAEIYDAMSDLQRKAQVIGPNAEVVVYYAGHGLPDENSKEAYLLASDANPTNSRTWYRLSDFYQTLSDLNVGSVMVFLDACFSGAERSTREGATIMAQTGARGAVIKAKEAAPKGNMFVLTAASGNETALPYTEKNHGLFTYFLLKKIQESKGNATLKELSDYVINQVSHQSNFINKKSQTPTVLTSGRMTDMWKNKKIGQ